MHVEAGEGGGRAIVVEAGVGGRGAAGGIVDGPGDGDFGGHGAGVGDAIAKDGDGESAFVGLVRDEGGEGVEGDAHGERGIGEIDAGERELAGEGGGGEAYEAGDVLGAESTGAFVGRLDARFQHAGDGLAGPGLHPDGGEGVGGRIAFVGAVEDFPIAKIASVRRGRLPRQRRRRGGKAMAVEVPPGEDARVGDLGAGRRGGRWGLGLSGGFGLSGGGGKGHLLEEGAAPGGHQV